jgi:hypothetical protein
MKPMFDWSVNGSACSEQLTSMASSSISCCWIVGYSSMKSFPGQSLENDATLASAFDVVFDLFSYYGRWRDNTDTVMSRWGGSCNEREAEEGTS